MVLWDPLVGRGVRGLGFFSRHPEWALWILLILVALVVLAIYLHRRGR